MLEQKQRLLHHAVEHHLAFTLPLGPAEIEQSVHDSSAAIHFLIDDLQVLLDCDFFRCCHRADASFDGGHAGADGGERVVDLVHHAGGELPDGGELFALHDLTLDPPGFGHVLADGDDVTYAISLQAHRDLAQPKCARFASYCYLQLVLQDLAGLEHPVEFRAKLLLGLPSQDLEDLAPDHLVAAKRRTDLTLPIPELNPIVAVHHIQADRQAIDDEADEAALLLHLSRLGGHLDGKVGGQGHRGEERSEQIGNDGEGSALLGLQVGTHLEQAHQAFFVLQPKTATRAVRIERLERLDHLPVRLCRRAGSAEGAGSSIPIPERDLFGG